MLWKRFKVNLKKINAHKSKFNRRLIRMNVDFYLCTLFTRQELGETLCYLRDTMQRKWSPCFLVLSILFVWNYTTQWSSGTVPVPLDGTQLIAVRGVIHQEVPTRVQQRGELNWALRLKPSCQQIFSIMSIPDSTLISQE